jgi:Flp pilus assembly protein TadG
MKALPFLRAIRADNRGNSLIEFALIMPAFVMLIIGGFNAALAVFAASNMQYAVEAASRCASVKTTVCTNTTTTAAYAKARASGAASGATFVASSAACGHLVNGTLSYKMSLGVTAITIPLTAKACFP